VYYVINSVFVECVIIPLETITMSRQKCCQPLSKTYSQTCVCGAMAEYCVQLYNTIQYSFNGINDKYTHYSKDMI